MKSLSSPPLVLLVSLVLPLLTATGATGHGDSLTGVTYDGRSLIINGKRDLLFSGSVHYPRSTPAMWPDIIMKAKEGGLNAIETYIFWNIHEPVYGKFNFEGRYDVVKFIKLAQANGMHVILRLGPFIQAEWNHGGLPYWLREVKNITFRTDNESYKFHMERFAKMIVQKFKDEKLFAWQGGPIILAQIENEYNNIARAFEGSSRYIQWAAKMAVGLILLWRLLRQVDVLPPSIKDLQFSRFLKNGFLLLARVIAVTFCVTLATSMAARQGPVPMAAFQICLQIWLATSLLADGLAVAGQAILASAFARRDHTTATFAASRYTVCGPDSTNKCVGFRLRRHQLSDIFCFHLAMEFYSE